MVRRAHHDRAARPRRLKLLIAYEGTHFLGWQRQGDERTVQGVLEKAFHQILREKTAVVGAGRTDSGVHAEGQAAHAVIRSAMPLHKLHQALNAILPEDLLIRSLEPASANFHARYSARSKLYRYRIWNSPERPLFERRFVLHVREPLNLPAMRRAARQLQGRKDFRRFHSTGRPVRSAVRTLRELSIRKRGNLLEIHAEADGFLYHMVRRIVGLLLQVGKGKAAPAVPPTAPARGLCLVRVDY